MKGFGCIIFILGLLVLISYIICTELISHYGHANVVTVPFNRCIQWATTDPSHLNPVLPLELFPEHSLLESHSSDIRLEILNYLKRYNPLTANESSNITFGKSFTDDGWRVVMLRFYGKEYPNIQKYFPKTMQVINQCGYRVRLAMFSILRPYTEIRQHVGPFRGCMRYHLGLVVPQQTNETTCFIQLNGNKHKWEEGQSLLFDDTFPHKVTNDTPYTRIVLFLDIQRIAPSLHPIMSAINHFICNTHLIDHLSKLNDQNEHAIPIDAYE